MIIKSIQDNIFNTDIKHIAFAINKEGYNDMGFAGDVAGKYWNELANCGAQEMETVLSKNVNDKTFHAIVCYSLSDGWGDNQSEVIKKCFDNIDCNGEEIATIAIGTGLIGMLGGANFRQIICGMHDSKQKIVLYSQYTLEQIINC